MLRMFIGLVFERPLCYDALQERDLVGRQVVDEPREGVWMLRDRPPHLFECSIGRYVAY